MRTWRLTEILRQKMIEEGLGYEDLAEKLGMSVCSVWRFLTGNGGLRLDTIERLMERYGLRVIELPRQRKTTGGRPHG